MIYFQYLVFHQEFSAIKADVSAMVEGIVHASVVSHLRQLDEFSATEGESHGLDIKERIKGLFTFRKSFTDSF